MTEKLFILALSNNHSLNRSDNISCSHGKCYYHAQFYLANIICLYVYTNHWNKGSDNRDENGHRHWMIPNCQHILSHKVCQFDFQTMTRFTRYNMRRLSWSILFAACRPLVSFKYIRVPPKIMEDSGLYTWDHISLPRKTVECVLIYIRRLHVTIWLKRYITITSKIQPIPFFHISWSAPLLFQVMGGGYPLGGRGQVIRRKLDSGSSEWIPRFERATLVQC